MVTDGKSSQVPMLTSRDTKFDNFCTRHTNCGTFSDTADRAPVEVRRRVGAMWFGHGAGWVRFEIAFETKEKQQMTEAAIRQALDKTRVFAERQRLLKELWRAQCASAVKAKDGKPKDACVAHA